MTAHKHRWWPVPGERGQYVCGCGRSGFRPESGGGIRAHAKPRSYGAEPTVRPRGDVERVRHQTEYSDELSMGGGRVPPKEGAE